MNKLEDEFYVGEIVIENVDDSHDIECMSRIKDKF